MAAKTPNLGGIGIFRYLQEQGGIPPVPGTKGTTPVLDQGSNPNQARIDTMLSGIGEAPTINYTPIAQEFAKAYKPRQIAAVDPAFFTSQRESLKEQLRREFFGQTGVAQKTASDESAAGRLGSGVGKRILEESVARPFMDTSAQIDRDSLQAQLAETARVQQFNAEQNNTFNSVVANLAQADSGNALQAATATATLRGQYAELKAKLQQAYDANWSDEQIAQLEADTRAYVAGLDFITKQRMQEEENRRGQLQYIQTMGQFKPQNDQTRAAADSVAQSYGIPAAQTKSEGAQNMVGPDGTPYDGATRNTNGRLERYSAKSRKWMPV